MHLQDRLYSRGRFRHTDNQSKIKIYQECHYTCENCSGPLQPNCTTCSLYSHRHLTIDYQCLCDSAYIDKGLNNIISSLIAQPYILAICHHSCANSVNFGEINALFVLLHITQNVHADMDTMKYSKWCSISDLSCQKCVNGSLQSSSCEPLYFRILNNTQYCICQEGYMILEQHCKICQSCTCTCKIGYFDNGILECQSNYTHLKQNFQIFVQHALKQKLTLLVQFRIDFSIIKKFPCIAGFYSDVDKICYSLNSTIVKLHKIIKSYQISQFSNRFTIFKIAIAKMDIMIIVQPQNGKKWSYPCKLFQFSSKDCQLCSSKSRHNAPICDDSLCNIFNSQSILLSYLQGMKNGYFEAQQIHFFQCKNKCLTCSNTSTNCLQYKRDRVNISNCICVRAYYDNIANSVLILQNLQFARLAYHVWGIEC
ncbi:unnamed protein product (macronuclear) [Paramecium tetraurelia]|uniref:TNFR-Cys domain-containing protein n=1 Tax=Paramecium tetraurelia TaxID=5888 RepID=A0DMN4_PARTE|nr:uncharacterized protein GSPATT00018505001 [Paramecium tetraurelia]CAK84301.1 unnamed protein product [Paramecium tetraurelia]|eukprot:XP_001451698.1 hypothetical protein (macronuclear) [Paramecium tetraurelia strain d4-2]